MLKKHTIKFLFIILLLTIGVAEPGNATYLQFEINIIDFTVSTGNPYGVTESDRIYAQFRVETENGDKTPGLSMHSKASDNSFQFYLYFGDTVFDGSSDAEPYYPLITLNTADWSVNTIDFQIFGDSDDDGLNDALFEAYIPEPIPGEPVPWITFTAGAITPFDPDETGTPDLTIIEEWVPPAGVQDGPITGTPIPEPATIFLFGLGLLSLSGMNRKQK